jgi:universal stress protein A
MIPRRILFCTDFSENSLPAREYAIDFAQAFGSALVVLHVVNSSRLGFPAFEPGVPFDLQQVLLGIEESVQKAFEVLTDECKDKVRSIKTVSKIGIPANEIVRLVEEESVDLIVMGTHGWTGFKHLILGSTAENVVRTAKCPVLTVKSTEENPKKKG